MTSRPVVHDALLRPALRRLMRTLALLLGVLLAASSGIRPAVAQNQSGPTYTVQDGDTLYGIAQKVGVSVRTLMRWNDLEAPSIQTGQTLRVRPPSDDTTEAAPDTSSPASSSAPGANTSPNADTTTSAPQPYGTYAVDGGDTFISLALRLGTTADTLFALNDSTTAPLATDRSLRLPRRFGPPVHTVASGQTLYSIAGRYGASVRALRTLNDLDTTTLSPGQRLRLPEPPDRWPPGTYSDPDTTGTVAVYPEAFAGRLMASGSTYAPDDYVVSHPSLPFGSVVLLSRPGTQTHTFARVLDRGSVEEKLLLDLSATVAQRLDISPDATPTVALRVVWRADE